VPKRLVGIVLVPLLGLLASCAEVSDPRRPEKGVAIPAASSSLRTGRRPADGRPDAERPVAERPPVAAAKPERDPDDVHRDRVVGVWKQNYTGVRWLSVKPDGTATMFIDPDWTAKLLIGDRLTIDVEWSIEDGHALMKSVGGRPEAGFKAAMELFGSERNRKIAELTEDKFVLLDEEDGSRSEWSRIGPNEAAPKEIGR